MQPEESGKYIYHDEPAPRVTKNYSITEECVYKIGVAARVLGTSRSGIVERAVRELYDREVNKPIPDLGSALDPEEPPNGT
jgi:hypothetical protein